MMTLDQALEDKARETAARHWDCPESAVYPAELTPEFPWLHAHALFQVQNLARASLFVAIPEESDVLVFPSRALERNLPALNRLLRREGFALPDGLPQEPLAEAIRMLLWGPLGFVGSPSFRDEQEEALPLWVSPSPVEGATLFETFSQDPALAYDGDMWTLSFYFFNHQGGVEHWTVRGTDDAIREATFTNAAPKRTFFYPFVV